MIRRSYRVYRIGNWIISVLGYKAWEDWANDGMYLEVNLLDKKSMLDAVRYRLHFFKPWIIFKYSRTI